MLLTSNFLKIFCKDIEFIYLIFHKNKFQFVLNELFLPQKECNDYLKCILSFYIKEEDEMNILLKKYQQYFFYLNYFHRHSSLTSQRSIKFFKILQNLLKNFNEKEFQEKICITMIYFFFIETKFGEKYLLTFPTDKKKVIEKLDKLQSSTEPSLIYFRNYLRNRYICNKRFISIKNNQQYYKIKLQTYFQIVYKLLKLQKLIKEKNNTSSCFIM